jgi:hypothetical protein
MNWMDFGIVNILYFFFRFSLYSFSFLLLTDDNQLTGSIPSVIGTLTNLGYLDFSK